MDKPASASGNAPTLEISNGSRALDRRTARTRRRLHESLAALLREKDFDAISLKEVLAGADVGRSTFYLHFRDKDDLLAAMIHDVIAPAARAAASGDPLGFSLPDLMHIEWHRRHGAPMGAVGRSVLHERVRSVLAESIAQRLARPRAKSRPGYNVPPDLLARYLASTFVLVLDWWIESQPRLPPSDVDRLFRGLALPVLALEYR